MDLIAHVKCLARERGLDPELAGSIVEEARRRTFEPQQNGPLVGIQGGAFAFAALAARHWFAGRGGARLNGMTSLADVVAGVESGELDLGVIPAENSISGTSHESHALLLRSQVRIVGEIVHKIEYVL
ncbi:MAG: prephenate dehydratase domain-containing protein [Planctomycetota bacterium]